MAMNVSRRSNEPRSFVPRLVAVVALLLSVLSPAGIAQAASSPSPSKGVVKKSPAAKPPTADKRSSFGVQPATDGKPDPRTNFSYGVTPGGQQLDQVAVINIGLTPVTLRLYVTDASSTADGTFDLLPGDVKPKDVGSWMLLGNGDKKVTVPARSRIIVPMKLVVPQDASPGDHTGGVIASLETEGKNEAGDIVRFEQRVAARLRVRVSGELKPKLTIENLSATYLAPSSPVATGRVRVTYRVRNSGNVRLTGKQSLKVTGLFGTSAAARDLVDIPELLPKDSFAVSSVVSGVAPTIRLKATVTVIPAGRPNDVNPPMKAATSSVALWAVPWIVIAILLVLILVFLGRRRRRNRVSGIGTDTHIGTTDVAGGDGGIISSSAGAASAQGEGKAPREHTAGAAAFGPGSRDHS